jgi:RNA polymerase sigma-70 factor (ECF subfamily)
MDDLEARWIDRARRGDRAAFEDLVRRHQQRVYGTAFRILRRHDLADDVTQDAFLRAWQRLADFDAARPFGPWICRIAANMAISHTRSPRFREEELPEEQPQATRAEGGPLEAAMESEARTLLENALGSLPPEQRAVFVLRTVEELSYDEIAEALDLAPGTVMSRLSRAREKLRRALGPYLGATGGVA